MHIVECGVDTRHDSPEFMLIIGREMMEELLGCRVESRVFISTVQHIYMYT